MSEVRFAMYDPSQLGGRLTQGEVIDDCPILDFTARGADGRRKTTEDPARVIVLSQACDLEQSKGDRVLVAVVHVAESLVRRNILKAAFIRDQVRRGQVYGWYFLPSAAPAFNLAESVIDLRDLHTISRDLLHELIEEGKGVCRLATPYREHLNQHFAVTYMRIGLPEPYATET